MNIKVNAAVKIAFDYKTPDGVHHKVCDSYSDVFGGSVDFINWLIEKGYELIDMEIIGG